MATNPHAQFTVGKPDGADTGPTVVGDTQENLQALRDAIVLGAFKAWPVTRTWDGVNTEEIDDEVYSNGTHRLRGTYTWQTSGGDRRIQSILYEFSDDSGANWDTIGTWTPTYAGASDHRVNSEAWT